MTKLGDWRKIEPQLQISNHTRKRFRKLLYYIDMFISTPQHLALVDVASCEGEAWDALGAKGEESYLELTE